MDKFLIRKSQATDAPVAKKPKLRKYDESYLQFGFNRAQIEDDLRICLSNIAPRFEDLCKAKQAHVSH